MTTLAEEEPFAAVVHYAALRYTCANCFKVSLDGFAACRGCHDIRYCSRDCMTADKKYHAAECEMLQDSYMVACSFTRLVSRILLRIKKEPKFEAFNGRTWDSLMDHVEDSIADEQYRTKEADEIYRKVKMFMKHRTPSREEVLSAWGKATTNSLRMFDSSLTHTYSGIGLYIGLSLHDHSCRPDSFAISNGHKMLLRTADKAAVYSNQRTITYLDWRLPTPTVARRGFLKPEYFFDCECEECKDEELDRKRQSGICEYCKEGYFSSHKLLELNGVCSACGKQPTATHATRVFVTNQVVAAYHIRLKEIDDEKRDGEHSLAESIKMHTQYENVLAPFNGNMLGLIDRITNDLGSKLNPRLCWKYIEIALAAIRKWKKPEAWLKQMLRTSNIDFFKEKSQNSHPYDISHSLTTIPNRFFLASALRRGDNVTHEALLSELPPGNCRSFWLCKRLSVSTDTNQPQSVKHKAAAEAYCSLMTSHGKDHPLTKIVEKQTEKNPKLRELMAQMSL